MRAADTNLVVRLIVRDDVRQARAAEAFVASGGWVSHVVLAEVAWVLESVYGLDVRRIALAVEMLVQHEHLTVQDPEVVQAALDLFRGRTGVSFSDCLVLAIARKAGHLPLGTFDRRLSRIEGAELV
jgi:predicted nucleic-acid-binding protein